MAVTHDRVRGQYLSLLLKAMSRPCRMSFKRMRYPHTNEVIAKLVPRARRSLGDRPVSQLAHHINMRLDVKDAQHISPLHHIISQK